MLLQFVFLMIAADIFGGASFSLAQTPNSRTTPQGNLVSSPVAAGRIQFAEIVHDFGRVESGQLVRHDFVFTNAGTAPLEIQAIRPGCGCTTAGTWDKLVQPGKTGVVPLQFNSSNFNGPVMKSATVLCNDPSQSNVVLHIRATVWRPIEVTPTMAVFTLSSDIETKQTKIVRITSNLDQPLELSDLQCTNRSFTAELKTVQPGKEFELHVTALPPFTARATVAPIRLKTSSSRMPMLNLSAYLMVTEPVVLTPSQLVLPAILTNALQPVVTIRNTSANSIALSEVAVNVPGVEVTMHELQPGRLFSLRAQFPTGFRIPDGQRLEMTVKSNHPKIPLIKVPVYQHKNAVVPATVTTAPLPPVRVIQNRAPADGAK